MSEPILIGITGLAGSGKDTAYGFIREWATERRVLTGRRALADNLKHSFARLFIPDASIEEGIAWCDRLKNNGTLTVHESVENTPGQTTSLTDEITMRLALQRYGTECHRQLVNPDYWLDLVVPPDFDYQGNFLSVLGDAPEICVVTDIRFDNEAQRILDAGGIMIRIDRWSGDPEDTHASEAGVCEELVSRTINNHSSLDNFKFEVFKVCDAWLSDKIEQELELVDAATDN